MNAPAAASCRTTCPYCGVGCGVDARAVAGEIVAVAGTPDHPANLGRLCVKGSALHETGGLAGRLLHPVVEGERASWDEALARVAGGFARVIAEHGPQAVAFYLSGQLLTEDYYVANKLMKGFIGSANVDTNSRLCMASAVAGYKRAFGADAVPCCYEDLECCDLLVLTGSNAAWTPPGAVPAHRGRQARATRHARGGDRSAAHRELRHRRPAPGDPPRQRCASVHRAAGLPAGERQHRSRVRGRAHRGSRRRARGGGRMGPGARERGARHRA